MTKDLLLTKICEEFYLMKEDITFSMHLMRGPIDSLDFLRFAKTVETFAKENNLKFDLEDFLYSECYTIDDIWQYLQK